MGVVPVINNEGRIISIGSTGVGRSPYQSIGDYAATKAALAAYIRSRARDLGSKEYYGEPHSSWSDQYRYEFFRRTLQRRNVKSVALRPYGEFKDIGAAVAFLASEHAQYVTGNTLYVQGDQSD